MSDQPVDVELQQLVDRSQEIMAHAWVVRAFVRHSDEAEDFPELADICRAIFDISRALETRLDDPMAYFKMLNKKLGKFNAAIDEYAKLVPEISTHTNFAQSVISMQVCGRTLQEILTAARVTASNRSAQ